MKDSSDLHESLRLQGLVHPHHDIHWAGLGTVDQNKFHEVAGDVLGDEDKIVELEIMVSTLEEDLKEARDEQRLADADRIEVQKELDELNRLHVNLERERDDLLDQLRAKSVPPEET